MLTNHSGVGRLYLPERRSRKESSENRFVRCLNFCVLFACFIQVEFPVPEGMEGCQVEKTAFQSGKKESGRPSLLMEKAEARKLFVNPHTFWEKIQTNMQNESIKTSKGNEKHGETQHFKRKHKSESHTDFRRYSFSESHHIHRGNRRK